MRGHRIREQRTASHISGAAYADGTHKRRRRHLNAAAASRARGIRANALIPIARKGMRTIGAM